MAHQNAYEDIDGRRLPSKETCQAIAADPVKLAAVKKHCVSDDIVQKVFSIRRKDLNAEFKALGLRPLGKCSLLKARLYLLEIIRVLNLAPDIAFPGAPDVDREEVKDGGNDGGNDGYSNSGIHSSKRVQVVGVSMTGVNFAPITSNGNHPVNSSNLHRRPDEEPAHARGSALDPYRVFIAAAFRNASPSSEQARLSHTIVDLATDLFHGETGRDQSIMSLSVIFDDSDERLVNAGKLKALSHAIQSLAKICSRNTSLGLLRYACVCCVVCTQGQSLMADPIISNAIDDNASSRSAGRAKTGVVNHEVFSSNLHSHLCAKHNDGIPETPDRFKGIERVLKVKRIDPTIAGVKQMVPAHTAEHLSSIETRSRDYSMKVKLSGRNELEFHLLQETANHRRVYRYMTYVWCNDKGEVCAGPVVSRNPQKSWSSSGCTEVHVFDVDAFIKRSGCKFSSIEKEKSFVLEMNGERVAYERISERIDKYDGRVEIESLVYKVREPQYIFWGVHGWTLAPEPPTYDDGDVNFEEDTPVSDRVEALYSLASEQIVACRVERLFAHYPPHATSFSDEFMWCHFDDDTYVTEYSPLIASLSAGSFVSLIKAIASGELENGIQFSRAPGHHSTVDRAAGFCLVNPVVIAMYQLELAARAAVARGDTPTISTVVVVDWDIHPSDGTSDAIKELMRFLTHLVVRIISIHRLGEYFYPNWPNKDGTFLGGADDPLVVDEPRVSTFIPMPPHYTDDEVREAFRSFGLPMIDDLRPDLIIVSHGTDAAKGEPYEGLLSPKFYGEMTTELSARCPRVAMISEGGYVRKLVSQCSKAVLRALTASTPHEELDHPTGPVRDVVRHALTECADVHKDTFPRFQEGLPEVTMKASEFADIVRQTSWSLDLTQIAMICSLFAGDAASKASAHPSVHKLLTVLAGVSRLDKFGLLGFDIGRRWYPKAHTSYSVARALLFVALLSQSTIISPSTIDGVSCSCLAPAFTIPQAIADAPQPNTLADFEWPPSGWWWSTKSRASVVAAAATLGTSARCLEERETVDAVLIADDADELVADAERAIAEVKEELAFDEQSKLEALVAQRHELEEETDVSRWDDPRRPEALVAQRHELEEETDASRGNEQRRLKTLVGQKRKFEEDIDASRGDESRRLKTPGGQKRKFEEETDASRGNDPRRLEALVARQHEFEEDTHALRDQRRPEALVAQRRVFEEETNASRCDDQRRLEMLVGQHCEFEKETDALITLDVVRERIVKQFKAEKAVCTELESAIRAHEESVEGAKDAIRQKENELEEMMAYAASPSKYETLVDRDESVQACLDACEDSHGTSSGGFAAPQRAAPKLGGGPPSSSGSSTMPVAFVLPLLADLSAVSPLWRSSRAFSPVSGWFAMKCGMCGHMHTSLPSFGHLPMLIPCVACNAKNMVSHPP